MRIPDYFLIAYTSFNERRGRSIGAIIGIVIAVTSLTLALGMGKSFQILFISQFEKRFGVNSIFVIASNINDVDIAYIKTIHGVEDVIGITYTNGIILSGESRGVSIMAIDPSKLNVIYGVDKIDEVIEEGSAEMKGLGFIMGGHVWKNFQTGEKIHEAGEGIVIKVYTSSGVKEISGIVVGLAKARQSGFIGVNPDNSIIMDIDTYFSLIDNSRNYKLLYVLAEKPEYTDSIAKSIRVLIPRARTFNPSFITEQFNKFIGSLQLYLGMISGISMFIIGLWIFDTMTINVLQRTKEIGIMKAIGFKKKDILLLFLSETILTTIIGVFIGIILTIFLAPYVRLGMFDTSISPVITPDIAFIAILLPFISNIFAAYIPARRAANLDPLGALRYE